MKKFLARLFITMAILFLMVFYMVNNNGENSSIELVANLELSANTRPQMEFKIDGKLHFKCQIYEEAKIICKKLKQKECKSRLKTIKAKDRMEWFIKYKKIQKQYSEWAKSNKTIYDYYTKKELSLMFKIVEAEVTGNSYFTNKCNVASVILNRIKNNKFPDTMTGVLKQKNQFSTYSSGRYRRIEVTKSTILACEYAFQIKDTTNGALFFDSCKHKTYASRNKRYLFTDKVGHAFYK